MTELVVIAAVAVNGVIGNAGSLPWHIPEDLKRFKALTDGHAVIMGRKTYDSLPKRFRPLPNRENLVISSKGLLPEEALAEAARRFDKAFVIGGESIYRWFLPLADRLELTKLDKAYVGDTMFPEIDTKEWQEVSKIQHNNFSFITMERVK